jgi:hypothetical protein
LIRKAAGAQARRAASAATKKSSGAPRNRLCGVGKSVKVSEDRTVVLTIFGAFVAGEFSPRRLQGGAYGAMAMLGPMVDKGRKKFPA